MEIEDPQAHTSGDNRVLELRVSSKNVARCCQLPPESVVAQTGSNLHVTFKAQGRGWGQGRKSKALPDLMTAGARKCWQVSGLLRIENRWLWIKYKL